MNLFLQKSMKLCSFSSRNDSIVMWGHYASSHTGFCIEYDISKLPKDDIRRIILYPVIYSERLFDVTSQISASRHGKFNNLFGMVVSTHKSPDWSYENEWRFVLPLGDACDDMNYNMPIPSAIYLGTRISEENENKIREIASAKSIPTFKMKMSENKFKLETENM